MKFENSNSEELCSEIIAAMQDIKGENIVSLDLREIENAVVDFFVICEGQSNTHTSSIAQLVSKEVSKKMHEKPLRSEGQQNAEWVLLDYGNVVVHVFQRETRAFYNLEELWSDAIKTTYEE